jgi:DNA-binding NarL/FixJ family response regulator
MARPVEAQLLAGITPARSALGDEQFDALVAEEQAMNLDEAVDYALSPKQQPAATTAARHVLTPREVEVVALVARGLNNRQIADHLVISTRTADHHVANILSKLGLKTRTQVATWALQHLPDTRTHTPSS